MGTNASNDIRLATVGIAKMVLKEYNINPSLDGLERALTEDFATSGVPTAVQARILVSGTSSYDGIPAYNARAVRNAWPATDRFIMSHFCDIRSLIQR